MIVFSSICLAETVYDKAQKTDIPEYMPKLSDVSMRTLHPHKGSTVATNSIMAAEAFHVTRLDWVYPRDDKEWMQDVRKAGLKLQPSLNSTLPDGLDTELTTKGRQVDVHGKNITAPWMIWPNMWLGCANQPEYKKVWLTHAKSYVDNGYYVFHQDDSPMNGGSIGFRENSNPDNPYHHAPGCFCEECIFKFHSYLLEHDKSWLDRYGSNNFCKTFLTADSDFTVILVSGFETTASVKTYILNGDSVLEIYNNGKVQSKNNTDPFSVSGWDGDFLLPFGPDKNDPVYIAEIMVIDRKLSDSEREGVENFLARKHSITTSNPSLPHLPEDFKQCTKLWLSAARLTKYKDGDAVTHWPGFGDMDGYSADMKLQNGRKADAPTFKSNGLRGKPAVYFDGKDDLMGVKWFNMRDYVLNNVKDQDVHNAAKELYEYYAEFSRQSTKDFFKSVMSELEQYAGREVFISVNTLHFYHQVKPVEQFDFAIGELHESRVVPGYLYNRIREATRLGKRQLFTTPVVSSVSNIKDWGREFPQLEIMTRKGVAASYALGGHMQVPWDQFQPRGNVRFFGEPEDYAYLFKFVRDNAKYFDDYQSAYVGGYDLTDDHCYSEPPVYTLGGSTDVITSVRAKPGQYGSDAVIHLVEWNGWPRPFNLFIKNRFFSRTGKLKIRMLFNDKQEDRNYTVDMKDGITEVSVPALAQWAIVVVSPE